MALVGYQLWRLRRNLKAGVFGSRLAARLVLLFSLVAVVPGALLYGVSVQFLGKSIESWFDVRVDRALEGGLNLGPRRARLSAQGNQQQGHTTRFQVAGRRTRRHGSAAQRRCRAGRYLRSGAVFLIGQHHRDRWRVGVDFYPGTAASAGDEAGALAADVCQDRAGRGSDLVDASRRAGQQRRSQGADSRPANIERVPREIQQDAEKVRPPMTTTRSSRTRGLR